MNEEKFIKRKIVNNNRKDNKQNNHGVNSQGIPFLFPSVKYLSYT